MARLEMPHGFVCLLDDQDSDLLSYTWSLSGKNPKFYAVRFVEKKAIQMHRVVLGRILGRTLLKRELVDHIDGSRLNNQRSNLRIATHAQNQHNRGKSSNNTSGHKGVSWRKDVAMWQVHLGTKHVGLFVDIHEAARAYNEAALKNFGEFAHLNIIPQKEGV